MNKKKERKKMFMCRKFALHHQDKKYAKKKLQHGEILYKLWYRKMLQYFMLKNIFFNENENAYA